MNIELDKFRLRNWDFEDIPALVKYANNYDIWLNVRDYFPHPYKESDARDWIGKAITAPVTNFAIATDIQAIGGIGFTAQTDVHRRSAEIGYWLGQPFWGQGITTMALHALAKYAFANFDLVRLYATVFEWNRSSARVLEKNGFKLEARLVKSVTKNERTIDSFLYALTREVTPSS
ncbi:MAG: N-acetyltransferase [Dehalococcoidia bacterium]|nr:MAG: N-acetyltransferase [Dehalococcoidia bacterium]